MYQGFGSKWGNPQWFCSNFVSKGLVVFFPLESMTQAPDASLKNKIWGFSRRAFFAIVFLTFSGEQVFAKSKPSKGRTQKMSKNLEGD